jgi:phosphatidylinositol alpha-mannosyltransferase
MKIGLVCPYDMFEKPGGVQQLVSHLADGLRARGHEVKIITPKPAGFTGEVPEGTVLLGNSTKLNISPGLGTVGAWTFDISDKDVKELIDQEKFDVINFHEPWAPILARQILNRSSEAHVGTFHANFVDSMAGKSLVNLFLPYGRSIGRKMQVLTAVSPAPASVLINKAANHTDQSLVNNMKYIPNGIDLKVFKPPKKRVPLNGDGTKTIVYIGRLEDRKGVDLLLKAFAEVVREKPHAYLSIGGEGKQRKQLEQFVTMNEVPNVNFLGYVSEEQKRHLMGNADLVCSPAMYGESFGIVLVEAMAMGAAVMAGNNIGYRSVLTGRGRLGLVDSESTLDFANRLNLLLDDQVLQDQLRRWSLSEVKKYDYPKIIDAYEAAYKEAIQILSDLKSKGKHAESKKVKKAIYRLTLRRHA